MKTRVHGVFLIVFLLAVSLVAPHETKAYSIFIDSTVQGYDSNIPGWLQSWGNTVTVVQNYGGEDLSSYDIVMDFDYDNYVPLTLQEKAAYTKFLNQGGGLYIQGERPTDTYIMHDRAVLEYLSELGAGTVTTNWVDSYFNAIDNFQQAVPSPVTQDTSLQFAINRSLAITDPGNGFFVAHATTRTMWTDWPVVVYEGDFSNIIGFEHGQLLNAPNGRLIASFDISGLSDSQGWATDQYLFKDVIRFLGESRSVSVLGPGPESVPEPSTMVLLGCGGAMLLYVRRRLRP